ncbi:MAG: hypothetical protein CMD74_02580 [Gammaproteobacteria bacterium]|nr:hypothetical protein [Gammaproteobacteria bacterium]
MSQVRLVRVRELTWADFNPDPEVIAAARVRQEREEAAESAIFEKLDAALYAAAAARFALEATRCVADVARKAGNAASRAEGKRSRLLFEKLDAADDAASAARMALEAARCVAKVVRKAGYAASRAEGERNRLLFTGGHYFCYGPLPGVSCTNKYGQLHFSPSYEGFDWKCLHCRQRKSNLSVIVARKDFVPKKLSVNSAPWYPKSK